MTWGKTVKLDPYDGMPRVTVYLLPETAECQAAMAKVVDWVGEHLLDG